MDEGEGKKMRRQGSVLEKLYTMIVPNVIAAPVDSVWHEAQLIWEMSRPFNCPIIHAWASRPIYWVWL